MRFLAIIAVKDCHNTFICHTWLSPCDYIVQFNCPSDYYCNNNWNELFYCNWEVFYNYAVIHCIWNPLYPHHTPQPHAYGQFPETSEIMISSTNWLSVALRREHSFHWEANASHQPIYTWSETRINWALWWCGLLARFSRVMLWPVKYNPFFITWIFSAFYHACITDLILAF